VIDFFIPVASAGFSYKRYAKRLEKLSIFTLADLLYHIPRRYEDLSHVVSISAIKPGEIVTVQGVVEEAVIIRTQKRLTIQKIKLTDNTGSIDLTFFNQPYIMNVFKKSKNFSVSGKISFFNRKIVLQPKSYEEILDVDQTLRHTGKLIPVYPETAGISSKWFRNRISELIPEIDCFPDIVPQPITETENLLKITDAFCSVHLPKDLEDAENGRRRLAFDELFLTHLQVLRRKKEWASKKNAIKIDNKKYEKEVTELIHSLPFELTPSQNSALKDIFEDLNKTTPMNRLLEGDVGSGKTIVAAISMYVTYKNGYQSLLMAPTEILAHQHFETISKILAPFDVKIVLVTSSTKKTQTTRDDFHIAIGTHALLHQRLDFQKLQYIVIDEQQRFGVEQRTKLREMGNNPHVLTMTATPIPRTIALTIYGDLALSYLKDMPKGRITVKTWLVPPEKRDSGYEWITKKIEERDENGHTLNQVFVVCPFIEPSENLDTVKAASAEYERLKSEVFQNQKIALLHGKMKPKEKEEILGDFQKGKIDILVTTPVVEVGIDIPDATIMLIEDAERFGLSQLHQLRGRVGRRNRESFCFLFTQNETEITKRRLKNLETIYNGAELAEVDLALRGPGQVYGTLQHGSTELSIASFSDRELIESSRKQAEKIFKSISSYKDLQERMESTIIQSIAPD